MGEARYLVSPKDLCALDEATALRDAGVDSFKIEGRLKSPEYVASTSRAYCAAVQGEAHNQQVIEDLKVIYSRDFFSGWMHGVNHQKLVRADFSSNFGLEIGTVIAVDARSLTIRCTRALNNGDGLLFFDSASDRRWGSPIYSVERLDSESCRIELENQFPLNDLKAGYLVFLNSSPSLDKAVRATFTAREHFKKINISGHLKGSIGAPLLATLCDYAGTQVTVQSDQTLTPARSAALTIDRCREEFSSLTGTPFTLNKFTAEIGEQLFFADRDLRKLRQKAVTALIGARAATAVKIGTSISGTTPAIHTAKAVDFSLAPRLSVLIREESQLEALRDLAVDLVYLDFEYGKEYDRAISFVRSLGMRAGIATTRILKPQEKGHLKYIDRLKPDSVLVRNLGALEYFKDAPFELVGDFSLNAANALSADWFFTKGLKRLTPSYDLNQRQLLSMIENSQPGGFEITIHQYIPAFHMEHCVFAAFLSSGTSWRDCGKPCEKHRVELRTGNGALHPLKADAECRNTMFNGEAQSAARLVPELRAAGVAHFRFEALFESSEQLREKIGAYIDLINGRMAIDEVFKRCRSIEQYGVSDGQLLSIRTYRDRKKEGGFNRPHQVSQLLPSLHILD